MRKEGLPSIWTPKTTARARGALNAAETRASTAAVAFTTGNAMSMSPGASLRNSLPTKQFQSVRSIAEPGAAGLTWGNSWVQLNWTPFQFSWNKQITIHCSLAHSKGIPQRIGQHGESPHPSNRDSGLIMIGSTGKIQRENTNDSAKQS